MKLAMLIFAAVILGFVIAVIRHDARRMRAVPEDTCERNHSQCVGVNNGTMNQTNQ